MKYFGTNLKANIKEKYKKKKKCVYQSTCREENEYKFIKLNSYNPPETIFKDGLYHRLVSCKTL